MALGPEHRFQVAACKLIKGAVIHPVCWTSVDRRQKTSALTHVHEKARGLKPGVSDIFLAQGQRWGWIELKAPGGRGVLSEHQMHWEIETRAAGGFWFVCESAAGLVAGLRRAGIDLHPSADVQAVHLDALRETGDAKRATRKPAASIRGARPMLDQIRRVEEIRKRTPF